MPAGDQYRVETGYDNLDRAAGMNGAAGEHLWIIICTYGLTREEAAVAHEGVTQLLDSDHLLAVTQIGCYICEQPYEIAASRRCPGEPSR